MRKTYVKPAIDAEEFLEQTSLACNLTSEPPYGWGEVCQANPDNYRKGGAWMVDMTGCTEALYVWGEECGPWEEGQVFS